MGIYIDMEMPKDIVPGRVIEFTDGIDGKLYARLWDYRHGGLTEWLEVVSVPPHGRLGDLDELAKDLEYDVELDSRILDDMDFVGKERASVQFDKDCKQCCMRYLTEAPTIIPASEEGE